MPSPFPGMNPYIEQPAVWQDFHTRFMAAAAEVIGEQVRPRYFVKIEEHLYVHERTADERRPFGRPDLSVVPGDRQVLAQSTGVAIAAPTVVFTPDAVEEEVQRYLEIHDRQTREVITVLELLSPSNKDGKEGRTQYLNKIRPLLNRTTTNLVEIDLLRGGERMPWREMKACDYYALVSRAHERPQVGFWPFRLREPLSSIPIPLRPDEPEPVLDLQALIHRIYDTASYELFIYATEPEPPLPAADVEWATHILNVRSKE